MKPNGRRRWRKWAKRALDASRRVWQRKNWNKWRRHRDEAVAHGPRGEIPPRPFSPRSLVGMSQGARKRAWVAGRLDRMLFPYGVTTDACEMQSSYSWSEIRASRPFLGERLRPCPNPWRSKEDGCVLRECHGSGVLPARGK